MKPHETNTNNPVDFPKVENTKNERIQELEQQARFIVQDENGKAPYNKWRDKFAELIVQECIQVCQSRVGNSDYNTGRMHCVSDIKEHFGIKS